MYTPINGFLSVWFRGQQQLYSSTALRSTLISGSQTQILFYTHDAAEEAELSCVYWIWFDWQGENGMRRCWRSQDTCLACPSKGRTGNSATRLKEERINYPFLAQIYARQVQNNVMQSNLDGSRTGQDMDTGKGRDLDQDLDTGSCTLITL